MADLHSKALVLKTELQKDCIPNVQLYQSGNMRNSINAITINDSNELIVIAVDYATNTNSVGRNAGWVGRTAQRVKDIFGDISIRTIVDGE